MKGPEIIYRLSILGVLILLLSGCGDTSHHTHNEVRSSGIQLVVLGNAQDAGYPQIGCEKECCKSLIESNTKGAQVTCLGIIDHENNEVWLLEASPDIKNQTKQLSSYLGDDFVLPDGIFLTHGHIGHYAGLMFLGKESIGANNVPVYAMPRMQRFLTNNGPWSQLVTIENIDLHALRADSSIILSKKLKVTPFEVPHRGEYTETVGFRIEGPSQSAIFIPDIDKWHLWDRDIKKEISQVDYAFLDATFFKNGEIARDMSLIPHPFVEESMALIDDMDSADRGKVHFIHFNHTNPLLQAGSEAQQEVAQKGYNLAIEGLVIDL